jgi:hypothetical protein
MEGIAANFTGLKTATGPKQSLKDLELIQPKKISSHSFGISFRICRGVYLLLIKSSFNLESVLAKAINVTKVVYLRVTYRH